MYTGLRTKQGEYLETLLKQLQESLNNHGRPTAVAFHIYELLSEAGYDDAMIEEVSSALMDIVECPPYSLSNNGIAHRIATGGG